MFRWTGCDGNNGPVARPDPSRKRDVPVGHRREGGSQAAGRARGRLARQGDRPWGSIWQVFSTTVTKVLLIFFRLTDSRLPSVLAVALTYGIAAYIVLPRMVRTGLKLLQRKRVPRFTTIGDDCPVILSMSYL